MNDLTDDDGAAPDPRTVTALADAAALTGAPCRKCAAKLCGHEAVFCLVLGYKGVPHCLTCVATHMAEPVVALRERTLAYVQHHECFHVAWRRAGTLEGFGEVARPDCLFGVEASAAPSEPTTSDHAAVASVASSAQATWDAGGMGCGDLVLELRLRLTALPPGGLLDLRATDPGAPIDLPAWCAMTGHSLVAANHPEYRIRRRS